jgi:hypothetical protein
MAETYVWELRNPDGGMLGLEFARGQSAPTQVILVHAAPSRLDVEVRTKEGELVAKGSGLEHEVIAPMSRLTLSGQEISRENIWPVDTDVGRPVILPGGEVAILKSWWNDDAGQEWRWSIELHNRVSKPLRRGRNGTPPSG